MDSVSKTSLFRVWFQDWGKNEIVNEEQCKVKVKVAQSCLTL